MKSEVVVAEVTAARKRRKNGSRRIAIVDGRMDGWMRVKRKEEEAENLDLYTNEKKPAEKNTIATKKASAEKKPKVEKKIHPGIGISSKTMRIMNTFINNICKPSSFYVEGILLTSSKGFNDHLYTMVDGMSDGGFDIVNRVEKEAEFEMTETREKN
ncbi:Histone-fold [Cynara cardunculus var. scolymus]|uniref:Histone-fold n=1 Tax=Cynara cardunculus var. scolymus TaxID=59895 RepID=A0A118JS08_CYNCS|nr:Histone-fold [Cynara cardunculus var. scolymus]